MNFSKAMIVLIIGFCVYTTVVNGMALDKFSQCNGKLTRENYIKLNKVCDMCYDEWKSIDILYNCDENCFQNDHFDQCRKSMNSIPKEMKEWISSLVKPLHDSQSFGPQASVDY